MTTVKFIRITIVMISFSLVAACGGQRSASKADESSPSAPTAKQTTQQSPRLVETVLSASNKLKGEGCGTCPYGVEVKKNAQGQWTKKACKLSGGQGRNKNVGNTSSWGKLTHENFETETITNKDGTAITTEAGAICAHEWIGYEIGRLWEIFPKS